MSGADSDSSDVELRPATFFYPAHQSNSSRGGGVAVPRSVAPTTVVAPEPSLRSQDEEEDDEEEEEAEDMKNAWIKYTHPSPELFAGPEFHCIWPLQKNRDGTLEPCGYHSKKHLVKRHIESKHLQLRCAAAQPAIFHWSSSTPADTDILSNPHLGRASASTAEKAFPKRATSTLTSTRSKSNVAAQCAFHPYRLTHPFAP